MRLSKVDFPTKDSRMLSFSTEATALDIPANQLVPEF